MAEPSSVLVRSCQYQLEAEVKKIEKGHCYSYGSRERVLEVLIGYVVSYTTLGQV